MKQGVSGNDDELDNSIGNSSSSSSSGPRITAEDGLSAGVLEALMQFQMMGGFTGMEDTKIPDMAVCATFTASDSQVIAETYRRLQHKEAEAAAAYEQALQNRVILNLDETSGICNLSEVLLAEGVVRVNDILSQDLCDACLQQINAELAGSIDKGATETNANEHTSSGFGNVFSRKNRYDMYLRNTGIHEQALRYMLAKDTVLGNLFDTLLQGEIGYFHEFSCLVSNPESDSQCIHPDSAYSECAPLWTAFVALQDVEADMGPTVFLRQTNTFHCHECLKNPAAKNELLASAEYHRSLLRKGDCAVMDSRTFHFGDANESETCHVLLYFTIRNPKHMGDYPPCVVFGLTCLL